MDLDALLAKFNIDGPHDPDRTRAAADLVAELVRYLNHATLPHRAGDAIGHPSDAAAVFHGLATALSRMPQLLNQIAGHLNRTGDTYGSDSGDPAKTVTTVVVEAASAIPRIDGAASHLRRAAQAADRLYIRDTP